MPINHKQQAFINEYMVNGHNATKAYKKAYPDCKSGHKQAGSRLLTNVDILNAIAGLMAVTGAEVGWSVSKALERLDAAYDVAKLTKQSAGMVASIVAANRMFGLDKDSQTDTTQVDEMDKAEADAVSKEAIKDLYMDQQPRLASTTAPQPHQGTKAG